MPRKLTVQKVDGKPGVVYYPLKITNIPKPTPGPNELLVKLHTASLNHRDLFIRQQLYPGISFDNPLFSDGFGTVVAAGSDASRQQWLDKQVILTPCQGWKSAPEAPEDNSKFSAIGGVKMYPYGTGADYVLVPCSEVELAPEHLTPAEAAALPLCGLTAWRALVTKCGDAHASRGKNVLITGIGGGVAIAAAQFAVKRGCNVYVTSGDEGKITRAVEELGARGGVSYKDKDWDKKLLKLLPKDRPFVDAIVDGAGGDVIKRAIRVLKPGGVVSSYGMTVGPKMDWVMQAVLKHIELRAATMGPRKEYAEMVEFVRQTKIRPVVSRVAKGLTIEAVDGLFDDMKHGRQFGKLVVEISPVGGDGTSSKL